jgi:hypothetical protein
MSRTAGILAFSACALGASAFLTPPGVALASNDLALTASPLNAKAFALQIPCSECVFSPKKDEIQDEAEDDVFWITGGANSVVLNFTVSEDGERLALNGEDIYPMEFLAESLAKLHVDQVPSTTTWEDIQSGNARSTPLQLTGSGVTIDSEEEISPEGDVMIAIKHTIFELEEQPVSIDAVSIKLLKTSDGELLIAHVETVERLPPPPEEELDRFLPPIEEIMNEFEENSKSSPRPHHHKGHKGHKGHKDHKDHEDDEDDEDKDEDEDEDHKGSHSEHHGYSKECGMLPTALCKLKNAIEAKVHGMKTGMKKGGCHGGKGKVRPPHIGKLPGHIRPHFMRPEHDGEAPPPRHHGRPHHMRPHGQQRHHHDKGFMHSFSSGFTAVLIPTLAGIAVGMTVSLLGLLVGRLISFLWIKLYRGGRRGYASVALDDTVDESENEKEVISKKSVMLEEDVEALPAYEQAPAYEIGKEEK